MAWCRLAASRRPRCTSVMIDSCTRFDDVSGDHRGRTGPALLRSGQEPPRRRRAHHHRTAGGGPATGRRPDLRRGSRSGTRYRDLGLPAHPDVIADAGALGGIYTALAVGPAEPGDRRRLRPALPRGAPARRASPSSPSGTTARGCDTSRGVEPLLACYQTAAAPRIRARIDAGVLKAADLAAGARHGGAGLDDELGRVRPGRPAARQHQLARRLRASTIRPCMILPVHATIRTAYPDRPDRPFRAGARRPAGHRHRNAADARAGRSCRAGGVRTGAAPAQGPARHRAGTGRGARARLPAW